MTDLERAHLFMQEHFDCQDVICTFASGCGCAAEIANALAAARREGAEERQGRIEQVLRAYGLYAALDHIKAERALIESDAPLTPQER